MTVDELGDALLAGLQGFPQAALHLPLGGQAGPDALDPQRLVLAGDHRRSERQQVGGIELGDRAAGAHQDPA